MVISYNAYPILKSIKDNSLSMIPMIEKDFAKFNSSGHKDIFNGVFKACNYLFRTNIKYISRPFEDAFNKARSSIANILPEAVLRMEDDAGVFIFNNNSVVLYKIEGSEDGVIFYASIFYKKVLVFSGIAIMSNDYNKEKHSYFVSDSFTGYASEAEMLVIPLAYLVFMRFAETETKEISGGQKAIVGKEKHKNETELKVRVVGCEWITTIIRTSGFGVRGHFRLQACGKDGCDRKLIWVNPFQKNGYTRRAQVILNQQKTNA